MVQVSQKVFRGTDTSVIFEHIKEELGEDAIILDIAHQAEGQISVTATLAEPTATKRVKPEKKSSTPQVPQTMLEQKVEVVNTSPVASRKENTTVAVSAAWEMALSLDCGQLFATRFVEQLSQEQGGLSDRIVSSLRKLVPVNESVRFQKRFQCLLGAGGAGKTSLALKLAGCLGSACNVSVGVLNLDESGSSSQGFERDFPVLSCPLSLLTTESVGSILNEFIACDLVFVDLPGTLERDPETLNRALKLAGLLGDVEYTWVVDTCLQRSILEAQMQMAQDIGIARAALTKLDHGGLLGPALACLQASQIPLSFMTTGRSLSGDIEPASYKRLAWLLGRQMHESGVHLEKSNE